MRLRGPDYLPVQPVSLTARAAPAGLGHWYPRGAVAVAAGVGALCPAQAAAVLGPALLVGLVGLGIAHGACDQLVLPAHRPVRGPWRTYLWQFVLGYLGLAGVAGLGWWLWPGAAVGVFFGLTAWHWGSADAPAHPRTVVWLAHSLLRGGLLLAVPAWSWPAETARSVNGLLALAGAAPVAGSAWAWLAPAVLAGHAGLWAYFAWEGHARRGCRDAGEVLLLLGLGVALPPLLALGVYFVFWHSLQHVLRLVPLLGYMAPGRRGPPLAAELAFFFRRAWPVLGISLAALGAAYALARAAQLPAGPDGWVGLAVVAAAVVTLPHALLVSLVMDAPRWRPARAGQPRTAPGAPFADARLVAQASASA